jgi:tetratricopeptide (TPR) repeat protein
LESLGKENKGKNYGSAVCYTDKKNYFCTCFYKNIMAVENKEEGFITETYNKTEAFVENNRKNLTIGLGVVAVVIGGYFGYKQLIVAPQEKEAQGQMYVAERYFEQDSLKKAINGDGNFLGFQGIIDEYGMTKAANLAHLYLGISYLKTGAYEEAIETLNDYDAEDEITKPLAEGAIGDAYMELNKTEEAIEAYNKAAKADDNKFTAPVFLMKAGTALESLGKYSEALDVYKKIQKDYFESNEGRDIEKYIAHAEAASGK